MDEARADGVVEAGARLVDHLEHHLGVQVQRGAVERDQLPRVGRGLRRVQGRALRRRGGDAGQPDDIGLAGAAQGAHAERPGGHAVGHPQVDLRVRTHHVLAVIPGRVADLLRAHQQRGLAFDHPAADQRHPGAHVTPAHAEAQVADRRHDLEDESGEVAFEAQGTGGGVLGHLDGEGTGLGVQAGGGDDLLEEVAVGVGGCEDDAVGGGEVAGQRDGLADVGRGEAGAGRGAAGGGGGDALQMPAACSLSFDAQRVAAGVVPIGPRAGDLGVVVGEVPTAHADVVGSCCRGHPAQRGVVAGAEVRRDGADLPAIGIEDAQVGVGPGRRDAQVELIARVQLQPVQVHILRAGNDAAGDAHALVHAQGDVHGIGQGVARVGTGAQRRQGTGRDGRAAQRGLSAGGGDRDHAGAHPGRHRQGDELLVGVAAVAVDDGGAGEAAHGARVDADDQVVLGQAGALEHDGVARGDGAAHALERGHDLQLEAGVAAQHGDRPGGGQRGHDHAERGAVPAAGAGEDAHAAGVVDAAELHQRAVAHALAGELDGLARHRRGRARGLRLPRRGAGGDAGEHAHRLRPEVEAGDLVPAPVGGHADGPVQAARGDHAQLVVRAAGDVDGVVVGDAVFADHAAHGDRGRAFHEARAVEEEVPVVLPGAAVAHALQLGHDLQADALAGAQGLLAILRVVRQGLAEQFLPVDDHLEDIGCVAGRQAVALPAVDGVQVEGQGVGLAGAQAAQAQRLAGVAEAPGEAGEDRVGVVGGGVAPVGLGAGLEVVGEDLGGAVAHHHVVDAPALVAQVLQPAVGEADAGAAVGLRGEGHRHLAVNRVDPGPAVVGEAQWLQPAVDHPHIAGGGQVGHAHLQAGAVGADQQRVDRHHAGGACGIARAEQHRGAGVEVRPAQLDDLAHVGRGLARIGWRAVAGQADDGIEPCGLRRRPVAVRVDLVDHALRAGHQQLAVGIEGQAGDLGVVHQLAAQVHRAQQRAVAVDLEQRAALVVRAHPEVVRGRIDGQSGMRIQVDVVAQVARLEHLAGDRVDLHQVVPVACEYQQMARAGIEHPARQVVVAPERAAGDDCAAGRIDGHHQVRVGMPVEDQQAARGHLGAAQRHRLVQHLQPRMVDGVGRAPGLRHVDALQHRTRAAVDALQLARVAVVQHPQRATGIHRKIAQRRAGHVHADDIEVERRRRAAGGAHRHRAQPVLADGCTLDVHAVVLGAVVPDVDRTNCILCVDQRIAVAVARKRVGARTLDVARAEQNDPVLDVHALHRGHDLQQRLAGRAQHLQLQHAVDIRRQVQLRAGAVGADLGGVQPEHLHPADVVHPLQQHVRAQRQPGAQQLDRLARVRAGHSGIGRRARQRHRLHTGQADRVNPAHTARRLHAHPAERATAQRQRQADGLAGRHHVGAFIGGAVRHGGVAEAVLGVAIGEAHAVDPHDG